MAARRLEAQIGLTVPPIITLLTDFGTADGYVGEMKGVLLSRVPGAVVVDITHDIPAHDVDYGRLAVARVWRRFPRGTILIAIVDPGVGSSRAALAVENDGLFVVGPDNGLLSPALVAGDPHVVELAIPAQSSATFHGRDVFAPAAAVLALGEPLAALGTAFASPIVRRTPEPVRRSDGTIDGEIIAMDRFGNAITNLAAMGEGFLAVAGSIVPIGRTYADVAPGQPVAVVGSMGLIEIAVRNGSAARALNLHRGDVVVLRADVA